MSNSDKILVVDIDGTLADCSHRIHHVRKEPGEKKNWSAFFAEAKNDLPHQHVVNLVKLYHSQGYNIVLCTGRPANLRLDTIQWLEKYSIPSFALIMRLTNERGPDFEVKRDSLISFLKRNKLTLENVEMVLEDRLSVANMWRELGLPVLLCGDEWR